MKEESTEELKKKATKDMTSFAIELLGVLTILGGLSIFVIVLLALFKSIDFAYRMVEEGIISRWSALWGIAFIAWGWGLLKRRDWARKLYIISFSLYLAVRFIAHIATKTFPGGVVGIAFYILLIYFLSRPKVKEQFR